MLGAGKGLQHPGSTPHSPYQPPASPVQQPASSTQYPVPSTQYPVPSPQPSPYTQTVLIPPPQLPPLPPPQLAMPSRRRNRMGPWASFVLHLVLILLLVDFTRGGLW